jgi:hypothetical protein
MKIVTRIFCIFIVSFAMCSVQADIKVPCNLKEMIVTLCENNEQLNDIISPKNIKDVMRALELMESQGEAITEADKANEVIKKFLNELLNVYDEKIEGLLRNEIFFKNIGILGFWGSAILTIFCAYDHLPHVSNEFLEYHFHSRDTHVFTLIGLGLAVFSCFFKAQGYQNENIALQDIKACIVHLKEALAA